jgi:hypothetical protein
MRMTLIGPLAVGIVLSGSATPAAAVQFVGDQVTRSGGHTYRGSLYYRDDMWRIEHNDPGSIEVTIVRKDKGVMWLLVGRTKQFATLPFDGSAGIMVERSMAHEIERETIGSEVLDGHPTTLFQITVQDGRQEIIYYQWWAEDLQLPLRIARKDGAWIVEYKNVKLRSLSPRLFDLPLNYRPIESSLDPR